MAEKIKTGEIYQLGEHKLACGDSTDSELVKRLAGQAKIRTICTDPPYGIAYVEGKDWAGLGVDYKPKRKKIEGDQLHFIPKNSGQNGGHRRGAYGSHYRLLRFQERRGYCQTESSPLLHTEVSARLCFSLLSSDFGRKIGREIRIDSLGLNVVKMPVVKFWHFILWFVLLISPL